MVKYLVLLFTLFASPVFAQSKSTVTVEEVSGEDHIAVIVYYNGYEFRPNEEDLRSLELWGEEIIVQIHHTANTPCGTVGCPDTLHIITLPMIFHAEPNAVEVDERQIGKILIYERVLG